MTEVVNDDVVPVRPALLAQRLLGALGILVDHVPLGGDSLADAFGEDLLLRLVVMVATAGYEQCFDRSRSFLLLRNCDEAC